MPPLCAGGRHAVAGSLGDQALFELRDGAIPWSHIGITGDYLWKEIDHPLERFRLFVPTTSIQKVLSFLSGYYGTKDLGTPNSPPCGAHRMLTYFRRDRAARRQRAHRRCQRADRLRHIDRSAPLTLVAAGTPGGYLYRFDTRLVRRLRRTNQQVEELAFLDLSIAARNKALNLITNPGRCVQKPGLIREMPVETGASSRRTMVEFAAMPPQNTLTQTGIPMPQ